MLERSDDRMTLDWRPLTRGDLAALDVLLTAMEDVDDPSERHSCDDLYESFDDPDCDPAHDTLAGRDADGELVAYGWNRPYHMDTDPRRVHLSGGVHPAWRRRGLGRTVLQRQVDEAVAWHRRTRVEGHGPLRVIAYTQETGEGQRRLYESQGLRPVRWYADMTLVFDGPPPAHSEPEGIRIVPFSRKRFEAVRQAHNEAFADHWGAQPVDPAGWEKQLVRPEARLSWSWVALAAETSEVVGYATSSAYEEDWAEQGFSEGWTDRLGVRKAWRERGIARALLTASMRSFVEAGLEAAGLGVDLDSPDRSFELYEELGYRSTHVVVMYAKTVDSGPEG